MILLSDLEEFGPYEDRLQRMRTERELLKTTHGFDRCGCHPPERMRACGFDRGLEMISDNYLTLCQRRDYLRERIKAKQVVGWDTAYDERELAALEWATDNLGDKK